MLRRARPEDEPFLRLMLYEAATRPDAPRRDLEDVLAEPRNARFIAGWGRPGDLGVVAQEDGKSIGAAWIRVHAGDEFAPGYLGAPVAQVAIAVASHQRGRGWGRQLLERLLREAEQPGLHEIQLTVGLANEVAVRLYESTGFLVIISDGGSARMSRRLGRTGQP